MTGNQFLSQYDWLKLPMATRIALRKLFNIPRSGNTRVSQDSYGKDHVLSDGTESEDLMKSLNVESALAYLEKEYDAKKQYDFMAIFPLVLKKAELPELAGPAVAPKSASEQRRERIQKAEDIGKQGGAPAGKVDTEKEPDPTAGTDLEKVPPKEKKKKVPKEGAKKIKINQKKKK